jgi:hypothetical protein
MLVAAGARLVTAMVGVGLLAACGGDGAATAEPVATASEAIAAPPTTPASISTPVSSTAPRTDPATTAASGPQLPPSSTTAPSPPVGPTSTTVTCDTPGSGGYDLLGFDIEETTHSIVLSAEFAPIEAGHNVRVAFTAAGSSKHFIGELFEDGSGVAQIQDSTSLDTVYLDGVHEFGDDHTRLIVPRQLAHNGMVSEPVTVELEVDGPNVETCASQ